MKKENNITNSKAVSFYVCTILFLLISLLFFFIGKALIRSDLTIVSDLDISTKYTIVIDAGHGGIDSGATQDGIFEKDLNLLISQKIISFLELYDVDVVMTRTDDVLLADNSSKQKKRDDLYNRLKFTEGFEAPIFVSVHMNKFPEAKYKGLQVFYSPNDSFSESAALLVQGNVKEFLQPDNNRSIKRADSSIYLLDRLNCPSILIECGFISNDEERQRLKDEEYQNQLSFVIANSIIEFINI